MAWFRVEVKGNELIDKALLSLIVNAPKSAARAGLGKGMTIIARGIRKAIPPKAKSVKKTVGQRYISDSDKRAKLPKGSFAAKVGLGVGKKTKSKKERDPNRPGVGISKENVHWWELGTKTRKTKSGKSTGKMPKGPNVVRDGFEATKNEAKKVIIDIMKQKIKDHAKKKRAKAKAK